MKKKEEKNTNLVSIHEEVSRELANKEVLSSLLATTFKGLNEAAMKKAMIEGMIRGFQFKDFLEKNVYAIPFKSKDGSIGYSLVTSIERARKIGAKSGVVGKKAPIFETADGKITSCTITVQKRTNGMIGDFTETVYFDEYYKAGRNGFPSLWDSKPRTMIAKVAEMHALRMACPEELSQAYVEEELGKERQEKEQKEENITNQIISECETKIKSAKNIEQLKEFWGDCPLEAKIKLESLKDELKESLIVKA